MPKLRSDGARTRAGLLEAAVDVVRDRGWEGATTRAIADRAGTPAGSIHYYFGSVDDLVFEALSSRVAEDAMAAMAGIDPDDIARWGDTLAAISPRTAGEDARLWLELSLRATQHEPVARWMREFLREARTGLAAALGDDDLATGLLALADGLLLQKMIDPSLDMAAAFTALAPTKGTR